MFRHNEHILDHNSYLSSFSSSLSTQRTYWASWLLTSWTACLDMKEDRSKKSALVCDGWSGFLVAASDLPRGSYRKGKEHYLICFLARRGWIYWSLLWHGYNLKTRRWQQNFRFVPRGRGVMAAVVGSFTLWLPTFARVAALLNLLRNMVSSHVWWRFSHIWWIWVVRGSLIGIWFFF